MTEKHNQILSNLQIERILDRISIEILENNLTEKELVFVGVQGQGMVMAKILLQKVNSYSKSIITSVSELKIDKANPSLDHIEMDLVSELQGKVVVLVDDVQNTGRTQAYALSYLMKFTPKKVETAILVNRSHTSFPIAVTYSGYALSTTLDNHIEVHLEEEIGAYLY